MRALVVRGIFLFTKRELDWFYQGGAAMLFPTAVHGYTPHHMDFPGTVTLRWNVFVESLLDCGRSLCRHGFDRILLLNGHGSNAPLVDMAVPDMAMPIEDMAMPFPSYRATMRPR